jgi:gliotoxin/aspirochlorine biosynthesis thioredoxin reductase
LSRSIAREEKYSSKAAKVVALSNSEILLGYKDYCEIDSANDTPRDRKLVLATGIKD